MRHFIHAVLPLSILFSGAALADAFTLSSTDIAQGKIMNAAQEFKGFGCAGGNRSPQLSWKGAPAGTEAYAVFAYDPDAPTGSGWWHWQVVNIPKNVTSLPSGAANPAGSVGIKNDYGVAAFGGACPPKGHGMHRYQFTVYALSKKLDLPKDASGALAGYMVRASALASSTIEALYQRD
ncbi:YbhB/YbcL family Raf kinase inhibitor-like protein [Pseudoduganella ginsengisoli]|uniref:YbhB/YbcL family Raf kinase inhibitor-like protein n=1 Tax=Pseudoduganella ginsengisoli TaxID=1462440 RepID=A0A6L6Q5K9_9BURK|nr:YbhB/YbcL family Raf kinase inhibitor-like protein [Pseudoduganella ginsengisoli]MTW05163.1 YbhB/YbcL family Raf kinase inhibitor-like protein [Pseudoduganella ginsengisoli]